MSKMLLNGFIALCIGISAVAGYLLLVLPWQQRWGATDEEVQRILPGDDQILHPDLQWTRAITVKAPATAIWPWLVQIGHRRAGYYSYPWLEKLMGLQVSHANYINPMWQHPKEGDYIPAEPDGSSYHVCIVEPERTLLLSFREEEGVSSWFTFLYVAFTWAFVLEQVAPVQTRLITRMRAQTQHGLLLQLVQLFIDGAAFVLKCRMLLGIKQRAERLATGNQIASLSVHSIGTGEC